MEESQEVFMKNSKIATRKLLCNFNFTFSGIHDNQTMENTEGFLWTLYSMKYKYTLCRL